ncbi:argininosuccinate lyase [Thermococcus chitonophagus]|uniref:Argininosuccinate lyase n=1 Tax=Thermococcus chitonophagus TaxID=54262 RepID=A0A160VS36_9EURY|nr:argininosuccinate lyase [Thermococcus chitonophagus]CUX77206.1 Argininosuccinate lyase [Thermococcus chitonophagus]
MYRKALLGDTTSFVLDYISSMEEDREIVVEVIECLEAHVESISHLIPQEAKKKILKALKELKENPGVLFNIEAEDVHEAIEIYLRDKIGEAEGYLALGKSRNDHVACALRLKVKKLLKEQIKELQELKRVLVEKAKENLNTIMPSFTHLQPAQPSTFAHYLSHIIELVNLYIDFLEFALGRLDESPLGAGAVGGTSVPLNRENTLFSRIAENSIYATSSRDFLLLACSIDVSLSIALSRIAEDLVVFSTPNFNYVELPKEHLATSSMMPQKKNPVTMEVARAWAGEALGHFVAMATILKGLPTGYNLDMQEANKHAFAILKGTLTTIKVFRDAFKGMKINPGAMLRDAKLFPILATDIAEKISLKTGRPYREVYMEVASLIRDSKSVEELYSKISELYGIEVSLEEGIKKPVEGSPNPKLVKEFLERVGP